MSEEKRWMARALELARRGAGAVAPNPMVGCVIVRGRKIVAEGYHRAFGKDHAEVEALRQAGTKARGATLYVNLEPCSHWGKTPPCAIAVAGAGVRHVVAAMQDPNPLVAGKGFAYLKKHGVSSRVGLLQEEAAELNRAFITWIQEKRPYVTLKAATSLDGKIATARGESKWITGPEARAAGHTLRAEASAVAVGIGTVLRDDPSLTAHGHGPNPKRVIFDSRLQIPLNAQATNRAAPTWILTTSRAPAAKRRALERKGLTICVIPANRNGAVSLVEAARVLARKGISHLLVEGGGTLSAGFAEARLVDEVCWFIAPKLIGGKDAKTALEGEGIAKLSKAFSIIDLRWKPIGSDLLVRGKVRR